MERCLELFERIARSDRELGLRELGELSALPVATVHRLLQALVGRGYVRQNPLTRRYTLGATALDLSYTIASPRRIAQQAMPYLRELVRLTSETANLAVMDGDHVVYLAQVQAPRMMRMFTEVGNRAPMHATGTGKVLLAFLPEDQRGEVLSRVELRRFTPATVSDRRRLRAELARVRGQGYAVDEGEYEEGVHCVAVPVRGISGEVTAAISVSAPSGRLTLERIEQLIPSIRKIAEEFSTELADKTPPPLRRG